MLRRTNDLKKLTLRAQDGDIGSAKDFYFQDDHWTIRYLVADTGDWLPGRLVLLSPHAIKGVVQSPTPAFELSLSIDQIKNSPPIEKDKPISRRYEEEYYRYYNYPYYWQGPGMWGPLPRPAGSYGQVTGPQETTWPVTPASMERAEMGGDPHLRSANEVTGYHVQATDGEIGHVEDFVLDDEEWVIHYVVVDTKNWWPGRKVLVAPAWANSIDWHGSKVHMNLDRQTIKNAPEFDMSGQITREYEQKLFEHYRHQPYWARREAA